MDAFISDSCATRRDAFGSRLPRPFRANRDPFLRVPRLETLWAEFSSPFFGAGFRSAYRTDPHAGVRRLYKRQRSNFFHSNASSGRSFACRIAVHDTVPFRVATKIRVLSRRAPGTRPSLRRRDRLIDWFDRDGSLSPEGQEDSAQGLNPGINHPKRRALKGRQIERSNKAEGGPAVRIATPLNCRLWLSRNGARFISEAASLAPFSFRANRFSLRVPRLETLG